MSSGRRARVDEVGDHVPSSPSVPIVEEPDDSFVHHGGNSSGRHGAYDNHRHQTTHRRTGGHDPFDDPFFTQPLDMFGMFGGGGRRGMMGGMMDPFGMMNQMMESHNRMISSMFGGNMGAGLGGPLLLGGRGNDGGEVEVRRGNGGGSQPYVYSSATSVSYGPGGLHEARHIEQDSLGRAKMGHSRGIGDQGRAVIRERAADGQERQYENLRHLNGPEDLERFDRNWSERRAALQQPMNYQHQIQQGPGGYSQIQQGPGAPRSNQPRIGY